MVDSGKVTLSKRMFNFILAVMSLLNGYAFSFFRGFSLAMIITTGYAIFSLLVFLKEPRKIHKHFLLFVVASVIISCVAFIFSTSIDYTHFVYILSKLFSTSIDYTHFVYILSKLLIWSIFITFCGKLFFDLFLLSKYMKGVILITFVYLIIQYVFHYAYQISIPCSFDFGFIKSNSDAYEYVLDATDSVFRPGSFWLEPGYLGYFYNSFLCICLFADKDSNRIFASSSNRLFYTIISCIGIFLSMSTGAIGSMSIILFIKFVFKDKKMKFFSIIVAVSIIVFVYIAVANGLLDQLKGYNDSIDNSIWKLQNLDKVGRVGESFKLIGLLPNINKIFGLGLGNELSTIGTSYMNGVVTIICWTGYLGLFVWLLMFFSLLLKYCNSKLQKATLFILFFNGIFASLYFGAHSFIYLMIALYATNSYYEKSLISRDSL